VHASDEDDVVIATTANQETDEGRTFLVRQSVETKPTPLVRQSKMIPIEDFINQVLVDDDQLLPPSPDDKLVFSIHNEEEYGAPKGAKFSRVHDNFSSVALSNRDSQAKIK